MGKGSLAGWSWVGRDDGGVRGWVFEARVAHIRVQRGRRSGVSWSK